MITFGKTAARIKKTGSDPLGRWSFMLLDGKDTRELLFVTIYQCGCPTKTDGNTTYTQQRIQLSILDRADINPKNNFLRDLQDFIQTHKSRNPNCIITIMGDFNESTTGKTPTQLCLKFGLVDLWTFHHSTVEFATHFRGTKRIDLILTEPELASKSTIHYEPFSLRIKGDHRGLVMEIKEHELFRNASKPIYHGSSRRLKSKDNKSTTKYINHLHKTLLNYNIFQRIKNILKATTPDHSEAELLDQEITRATTQAEAACRVRRSSSWNPS